MSPLKGIQSEQIMGWLGWAIVADKTKAPAHLGTLSTLGSSWHSRLLTLFTLIVPKCQICNTQTHGKVQEGLRGRDRAKYRQGLRYSDTGKAQNSK